MTLEFRHDRETCPNCHRTFSRDYIRKQRHKCKIEKTIDPLSTETTHSAPTVGGSSPKSEYEQRLLEKIPEVKMQVEAQAARFTSAVSHQIKSSIRTARSRKRRKKRNNDNDSGSETRMSSEFPRFATLFKDVQTPHLITVDDYMFPTGDNHSLQDRYSVVVATLDEARHVLEREDPLRRPIVVPNGYVCRLTMDTFLTDLASRPSVDVQEQDMDLLLTHGQPRPYAGRDAVRMFRSGTRYLNLLNLECIVDNPTPPPLENLWDYSLLARVKDDYTAGKKEAVSIRDLTNCASFQICATAGCWSEMHHDSYGKVTTIHGEVGEKAWLTWPRFNEEELRVWTQAPNAGYAYHPDLKPMMLHLQAGDLLIMPSNTPHAPYTVTDCLMTGTQHFHSASMHVHIQAANLERKYPNITNENEAYEASTKFRLIRKLMLDQHAGYTWPSMKNIEVYCEEFKVLSEVRLYD